MRRAALAFPAVAAILLASLSSPSAGEPWQAPSTLHLLGTDEFGRDMLLSLSIAAMQSLVTGMILAALVMIVATTIAAWIALRAPAGVGRLQLAIAQVVESVPVMIWVLAAVAATGGYSHGVAVTAFTLAILPFGISILVGEFERLRHLPYIEVALLLRVPFLQLVTRHLLPNAMETTVPLALQISGLAIAIEGATGLLGFTNRTDLNLGVMLLRGKENAITHPTLLLASLAAMAIIYAYLLILARSQTKARIQWSSASS